MSNPRQVRYRVVHETTYEYTSQVSSSRQIAHLSPRIAPWQEVVSHHIDIVPACAERMEGLDFFGNRQVSFLVETAHHVLTVRAESEVVVSSQLPLAAAASAPWEKARSERGYWRPGQDLDVEQYRVPSPNVPLLAGAREYAEQSFPAGRPWFAAMLDLATRIRKDFTYDPEATTISTTVAEVLELRRGVCQDFTHLMLSCLRSLGLSARYVSGYVLNRPSDDGTQLTGADASHAWVAAYCPGQGWVAFDPTNGKVADTEFVTLGWGREFLDVTPLRGVVLGAASQTLTVAVSVEPVPEPKGKAARA